MSDCFFLYSLFFDGWKMGRQWPGDNWAMRYVMALSLTTGIASPPFFSVGSLNVFLTLNLFQLNLFFRRRLDLLLIKKG